MAFRSKAQRAINGCSLDKRCNAVCGTPWKRPAGEFVRAPSVASISSVTTLQRRNEVASKTRLTSSRAS